MGVLDGRTALVTGGGQGIARAICEALATEGALVAIIDINAEAGEATAKAIELAGGTARFLRCNVVKPEQIEASIAGAIEAFGRLDVLVNAAQYFAPVKALELTTAKDWDLSHATGPLATLRFMQGCFPHMKERGGSIVNFTSGSALTGMKYTAPYSAAKGAITALSKVAANEWATHNVRVNVLCPFALTEAQERLQGGPYDNYARTAALSPMRRGADPRTEIAPVVVFLASDASRFITGTIVHADGGLNELSAIDYGETPGVFGSEA